MKGYEEYLRSETDEGLEIRRTRNLDSLLANDDPDARERYVAILREQRRRKEKRKP